MDPSALELKNKISFAMFMDFIDDSNLEKRISGFDWIIAWLRIVFIISPTVIGLISIGMARVFFGSNCVKRKAIGILKLTSSLRSLLRVSSILICSAFDDMTSFMSSVFIKFSNCSNISTYLFTCGVATKLNAVV